MAKGSRNEEAARREDEPKKRKGFRCADDLELLKLILEENPRLRIRVMYMLESTMGKRSS